MLRIDTHGYSHPQHIRTHNPPIPTCTHVPTPHIHTCTHNHTHNHTHVYACAHNKKNDAQKVEGVGSDSVSKTVQGAAKNAEMEGYGGCLRYVHCSAVAMTKEFTGLRFDAIITNPPWGVSSKVTSQASLFLEPIFTWKMYHFLMRMANQVWNFYL